MIVLRYVGNAFLPGVPARDLTEADIAAYGLSSEALISSGLYEAANKTEDVDNGRD